MKHIILITLVLFMFTAVHADMFFGVRAGLNIADLSGDDADETDSIIGFHIGGMMQYFVSPDILIQPELLFTQKGYEVEYMGHTEDVTLSYLEIPVLAKYNFDLESVILQPFLGPALGILIDDDDTEAEGIDFGLHLGLDAVLMGNLLIGLRYNLGLTDVFEDVDAKNSVFMIGVGYMF